MGLLPVGMHEEHDEFDIETSVSTHVTHNAAIGSNAQFADVGRVGGVIWGRWQGDYVLQQSINTNPVNLADINPVNLPYVGDLHFIYSDNLTTITEMAGMGGIRATLQLYMAVAGTLPTGIVTDTTGTVTNSAVGTTLPTIRASLDFNNQQLIYYAIDVDVVDANAVLLGTWSATNSGPVKFIDLSRSFNLLGTAVGCPSCYGQASLLFVGNEAGAAMSSYSIINPVGGAGTYGVNGVALLTPAGGAVNTPVTALFAMGDTGNPTTFTVSVGAGSLDSLYVDITTKAPTAAFHLAGAGGTQYQMMLANVNPSVAATVATATLLDTAGIATGTVYWGRWNAYDASVIDSSSTTSVTLQNEPLHFIHTSNILTPTQLAGLTATAINYFNPVGGDHSFHDGITAVTSPATTFTIQANFAAPSFTYGVTSTNGTTLLSGTGMWGTDPNIPFSQMNGFALVNTGCLTCTGNANLQFAGSITNGGASGTYASHAITGYTLTDGINHAAGVALLSGN